jgi:hypothetical protein
VHAHVLLFAPVGSFGSLFIEPKIVCLLFILLFSISRDGAQVVIIHKNILPNLAIFNINNSKKKKKIAKWQKFNTIKITWPPLHK